MSVCTGKPYDGSYSKKVDEAFGVPNALYEYNPGKCLLPPTFSLDAQRILDAPVRQDDVWLISFPRTGSTWCQEMIWLILNNLDFERAKSIPQQNRAPLIEMSAILFQYADSINEIFSITDTVKYVENMASPRTIKSHLPLGLLPKQLKSVKPKIIYTMRNPKDLCVSYYHYSQMFHDMSLSFDEFAELFVNNALPFGSIWNHYFEFWNRRHDPNVLILKYEDMKKDVKDTLKQVANHLEKSLKESEIDALCEFLSFKNMRDNKGCNLETFVDNKRGPNYYKTQGKHFIRKGIVGDWRNYMSSELSGKFDEWIKENTRGTDLHFEE